MADLALALEILSGASTIAVILGVPFILFQVRQNARLVDVSIQQSELIAQQNRAQVLLSITDSMTDREFVIQRRAVRDIVAKHEAEKWASFVNSADGFEIRAFAVRYEAAGLMAHLGLIDERTLLEAMGPNPAVDWLALQPALAAFEKAWGPAVVYPNFRRLAERSEQLWISRGATALGPFGGASGRETKHEVP